ncbi:MAG: hypothetical protein HKO99_05480 [Xanthomonadales bacterium]|nr:hypothetical protein [Gammaproteobacteria bacterium]MBT8054921.1 hypothetical protein [Gammaproteobacteria bacterium]NNK51035.1 hypothetical protein [Xanthomonadales bacterium]
MMNLLDQFVLQHVQVSVLKAKLIHVSKDAGSQQAKVELNLTPRLMQTDSGDELPSYQVSARLSCKGGAEKDAGPKFVAQVGFEAIYQQVEGDPVDVSEFTANHASLTRQLYPLLQQELRMLLVRLGLEQIHLPFDLAAKVNSSEQDTIRISGALH